ncbi:MAG: hypothetical protein K2Q20_03995, partial [Phycisphaerales bacterium]|nr:hypothetical protein [Phycisphaerales bacterium]
MLDRETLAAELNVAASQAGAAYAEVCLQNGVDQLFFRGLPGPISPAELHERAVKLYARDSRFAPSVRGHPPKSGPRGRLRRTSGGIHDTARYTLEFAEVLAWCAGVRARPPIGHMPTQPAVSATIWILWSGGVGENQIHPVRAPALKRARRA